MELRIAKVAAGFSLREEIESGIADQRGSIHWENFRKY